MSASWTCLAYVNHTWHAASHQMAHLAGMSYNIFTTEESILARPEAILCEQGFEGAASRIGS